MSLDTRSKSSIVNKNTFSLLLLVFLVVSCLVLVSCRNKAVETLKRQGELVVLTRNAPTTWYQDRDGESGFEYDLAHSFAKFYSLNLRFKIIDTIAEMLVEIQNGNAHIAAAGITKTELREEKGYVFGPVYQRVQQQVVCRRGTQALPKTIADLAQRKLTVIAASSYTETLQQLKADHVNLSWDVVADSNTEELLERVWNKEIDCTLADSNITKISRRYYPELATRFSVSNKESLAWVVSPKWKGLVGDIDDWLKHIKENGDFAAIEERYYGHIRPYDFVDNRSFTRRIKTRLPKYRKYFEQSAKKYKVPWSLLAAQSYQESHWNPYAKSPTGVRGMMMLTLDTAESVGVVSRVDPAESINGGAKYLKKMIRRIPEEVINEDRLWYALAAYNIGLGHLKDAMALAAERDLNPNQWVNLKTVLPLLAKKRYYKNLKNGYARGSEAVRYVQSIREYQQVLDQALLTSK